jgi:coenzyme F420 biosynthesis associated uncharacterized protein
VPPDPTVDWDLAQRVAVRVAGREPFAQSYHWDSLEPDFAEFTAIAEELVAETTGLRSLAGPARARVLTRADWVGANVSSFQRLLRPLLDKFADKVGRSPMAPLTRRATGMEVGAMLGWMSGRVLGQYDLLVIEDEDPDDQDLVYYVGPNVLAIEKLYAFPPREFRLWLALHEVTHRAQFTGVPWMREHFLGLVQRTLESVDPDPAKIFAALDRVADSVRHGRNPLEDGGLASLIASPEQRAVLDEIGGLMSLLEGHGDVTMSRAGKDLVPNAARFGRVLSQRRQSAKGLARLMQQIIGLDAKLKQYEQGERFIEEVEGVGGTALLDLAWGAPENLPTLAEIRQPADWVARVRPADAA